MGEKNRLIISGPWEKNGNLRRACFADYCHFGRLIVSQLDEKKIMIRIIS